MSYCEKCGAKVPEEAKFCTKCGAPQKTGVENSSINEKNDYNNEYTQEMCKVTPVADKRKEVEKYNISENNSNNGALKAAILGVLIGLLLLAVGFGAYYLYVKNDKALKEQTTETKSTENTENSKNNSSANGNNISTDKSKINTANTSSKSDEYMFSDSANAKLTDNQVSSLSKANLALARNEIFARHGYIFQTEPFKTYFSKKTWYKANAAFKGSDEEISSAEKYNVDLLLKYENKK